MNEESFRENYKGKHMVPTKKSTPPPLVMTQDSVDVTIKTLTHRIRRDKRIADEIEAECGNNSDKLSTVKSLRNKVRRMGSARRVLKDYNGCWEI